MGNAESYLESRDEDNETANAAVGPWHAAADPGSESSPHPGAHDNGDPSEPNALITTAMHHRKGSAFLDEPVVSKSTERGEAVIVGGGSDDDGREGGRPDDGCGSRLRYAVSEMQGWRSHMEDKHVINPKLHSNRQQKRLLKDHHLFAVFDGHGGAYASDFCGENFLSTLVAQRDWRRYLKLSGEGSITRSRGGGNSAKGSVVGLGLLKSALTSTFLELDAKLMEAQREKRLSQLSQLESLVYSLGGNGYADVFLPGTNDHSSVINFDRTLPPSMPNFVPLERSGSTGVVVLITPSHILCANAGDSRAILSKKSESGKDGVFPLSFDHKPNNDVEVTRVERDGGFVRSGRVDGDLAVSRGFGDFGYKNKGLGGGGAGENERSFSESISASERTPGHKRADSTPTHKRTHSLPKDNRVTVQPDILVHTREPDRDEFVLLACDGIWDRLSNRDCVELVRSLVHDEGECDVGLVCEEVIDTALELDSRDNMTVCAVFFPAAELAPATAAPNKYVGVLKRRADRERRWGEGSTPAGRAQDRLEERRRKNRELIAAQQKAKSSSKNKAAQKKAQATTPSLEKRASFDRSARAQSREKARAQSREMARARSREKSRPVPVDVGASGREKSRTEKSRTIKLDSRAPSREKARASGREAARDGPAKGSSFGNGNRSGRKTRAQGAPQAGTGRTRNAKGARSRQQSEC